MKVRLLTSMATAVGESYAYGAVVDMPEPVAARLIATGQAAPVPEGQVERAVVEPPQQAVAAPGRRRGRR